MTIEQVSEKCGYITGKSTDSNMHCILTPEGIDALKKRKITIKIENNVSLTGQIGLVNINKN